MNLRHSLILLSSLLAAVDLSHGHVIKQPGFSFSGSSSSASAFSHSSSNSFTINGDLDPSHVEALKDSLKAGSLATAGAVAKAQAGSVAGVQAEAGSVAGASAGSVAGAQAGSVTGSAAAAAAQSASVAGADAGSVAGAHSGSAVGAETGSVAGAHSGNAVGADSGSVPGAHSGNAVGADSGSVAGAHSGNAVGAETGSVAGADTDAVSAVKGDKLNADVGVSTVPACSGEGACEPAAVGSNSIVDASNSVDSGAYKNIGSEQYTTGYTSGSQTNYAVSGNYAQSNKNAVGGCASCKGPFPGPNGSIHDYKLASAVPTVHGTVSTPVIQPVQPSVIASSTGSNTYQQHHQSSSSGAGYSGISGHVSPNLIATLPGPSGSIYDSKPASAGAAAGASSGGSYNDGSYYHGASQGPSTIPQPAVAVHVAPAVVPVHPTVAVVPTVHAPAQSPGLSGIIAVLPGPSGSIYDSKPASAVSGQHYHSTGSINSATALHQESSAAHNAAAAAAATGGVTNIPASHPVVGPACGYAPGSVNNCGGVPASGHQANSGSEVNYSSGSGSITYHQQQAGSGVASQSGAIGGTGCSSCKGPFPGPTGSIHAYKPASTVPSSGSLNVQHSSSEAVSSQHTSDSSHHVVVPSVHPTVPTSQVPSGTYYINKPPVDVLPPAVGPTSFSGQFPCTDNTCGSVQPVSEVNVVPTQPSGGCSAGSSCGSSPDTGSVLVYTDKDYSNQYHHTQNHDQAHLSGGLVYPKEDGSYYNVPTTAKPIYKNAEHGSHAVSTDEAQNTGILIGPGTGHLPIDSNSKPFGTQGAFGGSEAFKNSQHNQGTIQFGGEHSGEESFQQGHGTAQSGGFAGAFESNKFDQQNHGGAIGGSESSKYNDQDKLQHSHSGAVQTGGSGAASVSGAFAGSAALSQNTANSQQSATDFGSRKPTCSTGNCGTPIKLQCAFGSPCKDTEVIVVEEPSLAHQPSSYGSESGNGFATGQVLINQGVNTYDVTNQGHSHSGSKGGCVHGSGCGALGYSGGASLTIPSPHGILDKLFGHGGLSGSVFNRKVGGGGGAHAGSAAYSSAGAYSSASAGSYASAGAGASAGASAHAGSYSRSF